MTANGESARARRYLLGESSEHERAAIEREYLEHEDALDRMSAAEDDLIEDYLADRLGPGERARFEQAYLTVPHRRVRVETIRRLMAQGSRSASARGGGSSPSAPKRTRHVQWMALAASLLVGASGALWMVSSSDGPRPDVGRNEAPPAAAPAVRDRIASAASSTPRIFALTLSPAAVRGDSDAAPFVIAPGTDVVAIRLERDDAGRPLTASRASIEVVGGARVWQGPTIAGKDLPSGVAARVEVPAARLPPDDYLVTLYATDRAGVEREWTQYFLRVRSE